MGNLADSCDRRNRTEAMALAWEGTAVKSLIDALEEVVYEHNGEFDGSYAAAQVMDNPLNALTWFADHFGVLT